MKDEIKKLRLSIAQNKELSAKNTALLLEMDQCLRSSAQLIQMSLDSCNPKIIPFPAPSGKAGRSKLRPKKKKSA